MEESYQVVTHGLRDGVTQDVAGPQLAVLFKCTREQIAPLLTSAGCIVKQNLPMALAQRYRNALEQCGMQVAIFPSTDHAANPMHATFGAPIPLRPSAAPVAEPAPAAQDCLRPGATEPIDTGTMIAAAVMTIVSGALAMVAFRMIATIERGLMFQLACVAAVVLAFLTTSGALIVLRWLQRRKTPIR